MSFGNTPKCTACSKTVYPMEELKAEINNKPTPFHKWCFKCTHCSRVLSLGNYTTNPNGHVYCKPDFLRLFKEKGNYNTAFAKNLDDSGQGQAPAAAPSPDPVSNGGSEASLAQSAPAPADGPRSEPRTSREKPKADPKPAAGSLTSKLSVFKQKEEEQRKAQMRALGLKVDGDDEEKAAEEAEREVLMKRIQEHKAAQAAKEASASSESAPDAPESEPEPAAAPVAASSSSAEEEAKPESAPEAQEPQPEALHIHEPEPEPAVQEREPEADKRDVGAVAAAAEAATEKIKELLTHYEQAGAVGSAALKEDLLDLTASFLKHFD